MRDWIEYVVPMQPLVRKIEEHLNLREYAEAENAAKELLALTHDVLRFAIVAQVAGK